MVQIALTAAFLTLVSAVLASPVAPRTTTVKLSQVQQKSTTLKDLGEAGKARLAHFNGHPAASGSSPITNDFVSYLAPVVVGSQTFQLIVDTGSSNTWVGANTAFSAGSTGKSTGNSVSVSYGSGSFSGTEYTDTVSIGPETVKSQSIGVASTSTGFTGVDGIVGFGPVDLTQNTVNGVSTVPTFTNNLKSQGSISTEVLGVYFKPESGSDSNDQNGELTFGATDSSKYTGSITYTPTLTSGDFAPYWGITVSSFTFGSTKLQGSNGAIVDTGTTLIIVPQTAYNAFLSASGGTTDSSSGLATFTKAPTATVTFTIGGKAFPLTPAQYLVPQAQYANLGLTGNGYYSWIYNSGSDTSVDFILGQKFLENYYSVFDTTNSRVGFATRT